MLLVAAGLAAALLAAGPGAALKLLWPGRLSSCDCQVAEVLRRQTVQQQLPERLPARLLGLAAVHHGCDAAAPSRHQCQHAHTANATIVAISPDIGPGIRAGLSLCAGTVQRAACSRVSVLPRPGQTDTLLRRPTCPSRYANCRLLCRRLSRSAALSSMKISSWGCACRFARPSWCRLAASRAATWACRACDSSASYCAPSRDTARQALSAGQSVWQLCHVPQIHARWGLAAGEGTAPGCICLPRRPRKM